MQDKKFLYAPSPRYLHSTPPHSLTDPHTLETRNNEFQDKQPLG